MTEPDFPALKERFRSYALSFADTPENVPQAIRLKIDHTFDVCSITDWIADREGGVFRGRGRTLALLGALFHDVSRFRQYREFRTFRDADSFDHGEISAEIFLGDFPLEELSPPETGLVAAAIRHHNKRVLPANLPEEVQPFAKLLRDADKLSIIRIIDEYLATPEEYQEAAVRIGMEETPGFTRELAQTAIDGGQIAHGAMRNLNDFKLSIFAWAQDINFSAAAEYILEKRLYETLRTFLPDDRLMDELLAVSLARLNQKAQKED